jgi:predicted enzyme related to lactoylglutathione lyase
MTVDDLDAVAWRLTAKGYPWHPKARIEGARRGMTADPEGNAIELLEAIGRFA